jgi:hypothetical protein
MDNTKSLNSIFETIAWGLILVLWGLTILFDFLPAGIGIFGTGLIFLGLNGVRSLNGIPTWEGTTILGILALEWGGLELADLILDLQFELSDWAIFAILLIVLGAILLARSLPRIRKTGGEDLHVEA